MKVVKNNKVWVEIIIIGTLILFSLMLLLIKPFGHDVQFHIYRIGTMASELQRNPWQLPIRMLSESYNGYGYGAALYYGDLFLYIPALFVCIGVDVIWAYKIFTVLILWGMLGIAYYSARIMNKARDMALIFAAFYTFSSYGLQNLCVRSAIGEILAFSFLPLVVSAFWNILYVDKISRNWLLLGFAMTAIALSHLLTLVLTTVVLTAWSILEIKRIFIERKFLDIVKAAGFMIGLSASFLFPMMEQMNFQKVQTPWNTDIEKYIFTHNTLEEIDYLIPYEIKKIGVSVLQNEWNVKYWHPGTSGLFILVLIGAFFILKPKINKKEIGIAVCSIGGLLALSVYRVTDVLKEIMTFMQFPWRLLTLVTLGTVFTGVGILESADCGEDRKKNVELGMMIGTVIIAIWTIVPCYMEQLSIQKDKYTYVEGKYQEEVKLYDKNGADSLYLPEEVATPDDFYLERGDIVISDKKDIVFEWKRNVNGIDIQIIKNPHIDGGKLELPLYMYKGYVAKNADGKSLPVMKSENGLVSVRIGDTLGRIQVWYEGTLIQKLSDIITLLTILGFLIWKKVMRDKSKIKEIF